MALAQIIPGSTPFGQWSASSAGAVGSSGPGYDGTVIMRWRTVPFQTIRKLDLGEQDRKIVVAANAYHFNGIQKVQFAAQGGAYVDVTQPLAGGFLPTTFNPALASTPAFGKYWRGGCYAAILDANSFTGASGQVEVRAIGIPAVRGQPRILQNSGQTAGQDLGDKSLILWVDTADGTTAYYTAYIQPGWMGDSELNNPDLPFADPIEGIAAAANESGDNTLGGWVAACATATMTWFAA
jgi:hypothetical protein